MAAKIKSHPKHVSSTSHRHRPKGVSPKAFEQVYWPFIPVILAIVLLLSATVRTGSLASIVRHPAGKVLSYASSEDPNKALVWTNIAREESNEPDLTISQQLSDAAAAKAQDMAKRDYWSHNTPDGNPPWIFVSATGYAYNKLGENLASGFSNEESVIKAWMASPPHRENLLDPSYTQVGFGFANIPDYKAVGGGPMTIVVAYYGQPSNYIPLASVQPIPSAQAPSTANPSLGRTLATETARSDLAFGGKQAAYWSPVVLIMAVVTLLALLAGKHIRQIKRAIKSGERFAWHHPLFDAGILIVAGLLVVLAQTAGFIQ